MRGWSRLVVAVGVVFVGACTGGSSSSSSSGGTSSSSTGGASSAAGSSAAGSSSRAGSSAAGTSVAGSSAGGSSVGGSSAGGSSVAGSSSAAGSSSGGAVACSPNATTFAVSNVGFSAYSIDGTSNATLTLCRGSTYTFNMSATGHPFWIKTVQGIGTANAYMDGVTGNGSATGTITFVVAGNAPGQLFYNCQFHGAMTGNINIVDP